MNFPLNWQNTKFNTDYEVAAACFVIYYGNLFDSKKWEHASETLHIFFKDATYAHEPFQAHEMLIALVRETLHLSQKREDFPHVLGLNFQVSVSALCSGIQSEEQTEQLFSRREK